MIQSLVAKPIDKQNNQCRHFAAYIRNLLKKIHVLSVLIAFELASVVLVSAYQPRNGNKWRRWIVRIER
jgi:hypothetical protein